MRTYLISIIKFLNETIDPKLNILDQLVSIMNNLFMV